MSDSYQHLDNDALNDLLTQHRRNLMYLEKQDAKYGGMTPLHVVNSIENEQQRIAAIEETLQRRSANSTETAPTTPNQNNNHPQAQIDNTPSGQNNNNHPQPQTQTDNTPPPDPAAPLAAQHGSPFVTGPPLRPNDRIFGREDTFRFIADSLARFSPVNLVGERRMGKTSVLNHLLANQGKYLMAQPDQPPLVLAHIDLQRNITEAKRFYGMALRELLANLPPSRSKEAQHLSQLHARLDTQPEATYDEFDRTLRQLRDQRGICVRPVLLIDEFDEFFDDSISANFPYPQFFNGLRALMTADLIALVVASPQHLIEYFTDSKYHQNLTSDFPTYFQTHPLLTLNNAAATALLTQGKHPLSITEIVEAYTWSEGHPYYLQVAGKAHYEAREGRHSNEWMHQKREEMKNGNCATGQPPEQSQQRIWWKRIFHTLFQIICFVFITTPLWIGKGTQYIGLRINDVAAWLLGWAVVISAVEVILRVSDLQSLSSLLWSVIMPGQGG